MSFLDFSGDYQNQKALLAIFGLMIMLSTAYLGSWFTAILLSPSLALMGGFSFCVFVGGILGFFVTLSHQMAHNISIKITKET
jgi:hypothetical protein